MTSNDRTRRNRPPAEPAEDCAIVVFGVTGDLAYRKLFPALHALHRRRLLDDDAIIVGCSRSVKDDDGLRKRIGGAVDDDEGFLRRVHSVPIDLSDPPEHALDPLVQRLHELHHDGNILFHLATPSDQFGPAGDAIAAAGLAHGHGWRRLIIEKPFGEDEASARALDRRLRGAFDEDQVHRIDHFLGKDAVQNLLVFRGMNAGQEAIWNRHHVDHVQITVSEQLGIESRGAFYEETGVVRDMLQNHLMQLLTLTAMELPAQWDADALHARAAEVLDDVAPMDPDRDLVLGQYGVGEVDGRPVPGYRDEPDVADDSATPTFVAARLRIENERWAGVPFYLRTGKRLARRVGEIVLRFKSQQVPFGNGGERPGNQLVFRFQPDAGIANSFWLKVPGYAPRLEHVEMCYAQAQAFGIQDPPDAYEHLVYDALVGDRLLFPRAEEVYAAWRVVAPALAAQAEGTPALYPAGSWGPKASDALLAADGRRWHFGSSRAAHKVAPLPPPPDLVPA
ncbi:MAG: glucose-6-phosphate dehydrogenase [Gemmatimonadota bacterium]|jgi:glucose-6-phosphate 1-dehydrogenase